MDKKIDNTIRQALTHVCQVALDEVAGYQWISHTVNYSQFPQSLTITCMFSDQHSADNAKEQGELVTVINQQLQAVSVTLKNPQKQIRFASE